jgi:hypothetical protein
MRQEIRPTDDKDTESRFSQDLESGEKTGKLAARSPSVTRLSFGARGQMETLGERLLVLRPYLAAGLPLSVQSYLERTGRL